MNKTLMLVICDFLLLSMLALARFDPPEQQPEAKLDVTNASETAEAELVELLEESLQSELSSRENLSEDLTQTRASLQEKARLLAEREAALKTAQSELESTTAQARELEKTKAQIESEQTKLAEEKARIEAERAQLAERFDRTRSELEAAKTEQVALSSSLGELKEESSVAKEKLSRTEEELIAREIALSEREAALKAAEEEKVKLAAEREALSRQLEVAQAERQLLEQNLTTEQAEKSRLQNEKEQAFARADRLSEGVSELGTGVKQLNLGVSELGTGVKQLNLGVSDLTQSSQDIQKEIEAARPQTMSEIFTRFQNNRASLRFTATEKTFLGGQTVRTYNSKSILVTDSNGANYLVTHSANSPFAFGKNANNLLEVKLEVTLGERRFPVHRIGFLSADPRILFVPLPQSVVDTSGLETFTLARQPERWEEAVLIKSDESNFGRTEFRRLTSSKRFLKMDRPALGQLFADFASSRGDLAFTKNSQFIGLLTDTKHAVVIDDFLAAAITELGSNFSTQENLTTMDRLKIRVRQLPQEIH